MLLIDEIDRADDEFEAFLFELLAESAVTIPELGTLRAAHPPIVVLTSNRTRDLHDALKRRCLYHWIDYPIARPRRRHRPPAGAGGVDHARRAGRRRRRPAAHRSTCRSRRASPRRSTGCRRSSCSASTGSTPAAAEQTLGSVLKYREDLDLARDARAWPGSPPGDRLPAIWRSTWPARRFGQLLHAAGVPVDARSAAGGSPRAVAAAPGRPPSTSSTGWAG